MFELSLDILLAPVGTTEEYNAWPIRVAQSKNARAVEIGRQDYAPFGSAYSYDPLVLGLAETNQRGVDRVVPCSLQPIGQGRGMATASSG